MHTPTNEELLKAGVHFGHMKKKWNPKMRPYIFMERKGIHIIDLNRTLECLEEAGQAMQNYARSGKKIMYVATKKQARDIVSSSAQSVNMPYVTDRWLGGMMTNFSTVRRSVKKMQNIDRMLNDGSYSNITKKERLTLSRERDKINKVLGGIADLNRLPGALFIVDIVNEHLAVSEATKLGIPTIGIVDTNSDPRLVDYPIPANDDNSRSIEIITNFLTESVKQGLGERKKAKQETPAG
ncbi:MAG: 30S ribosomal protein S2 [Saprospirales bacterium]|nr:MAG: 30S ribosomal protein S2 [Saprospirales bacterium]